MDPNEALKQVLRILVQEPAPDNYREELIWHLRGLADWLDKGGFMPEPPQLCKDCAGPCEWL